MFRSLDGSGSESLEEIPWGWRHHLRPFEIHEEMYLAPVEITKLGSRGRIELRVVMAPCLSDGLRSGICQLCLPTSLTFEIDGHPF